MITISIKSGIKIMYAQALWDLSVEKPLSKITVGDIITKAKTARQTFYNHFTDKNELMDYVLELWLSIATKGFPSEKTWLECMSCAADFALDHKAFFTDLNSLQNSCNFIKSLNQAFSVHITHLISSENSKISNSLHQTIAFYSFGAAGAFSSWVRSGMDQSTREVGLLLYDCLPPNLRKHLGGIIIKNQQRDDGIETILASRFYIYQVFHLLFGTEPTYELIDVITNGQTAEALLLFSQKNDDGIHRLMDNLKSLPPLDDIKDEYTRLLIGPNKLPAHPWESVYVSKDASLFKKNTLEVRQFYGKFGYRTVSSKHVADDHISLMLDFMANMSQRAYGAFHDGAYARARELLIAQHTFLYEHMKNWIPRYSENLQKSGKKLLYPQCASALCDIMDTDYIFIEKTLSLITVY